MARHTIYIYIYIYIYISTNFKNKHYTIHQYKRSFLQSSYVHAKVTSLLEYTPPLMMVQDWAENIRETINYERFINQFPPDIIRLIHQLERINIKICRQKMSMIFNQIYIYIYIYIYIVAHTKVTTSRMPKRKTQ